MKQPLQILLISLVFIIISPSIRHPPPPACVTIGPPPRPGESYQPHPNACPPPTSPRPPKALDKNVTQVIQTIIVNNTINTTLVRIIDENWKDLTFKYKTCLKCLELFPKQDFYEYIYNWLKSENKILTFPVFFQKFFDFINSGKTNLRLLSPPSAPPSKPPSPPPKSELLKKQNEVPFCFLPGFTDEDNKIQDIIIQIDYGDLNDLKYKWGNNEWHTIVCQKHTSDINAFRKSKKFEWSLLNYLDSKCSDDDE